MGKIVELEIGKIKVVLSLYPGDTPGMICADYVLTGKGSNYRMGKGQVCVNFPEIREAVLKSIAARGPVGWSWKQLRRKANSLAHKVSINKIAREVSDIASDPRFQKVASMAAVIYPPLGMPMGAVVATAKLYKSAQAGDPAARAKVMKIITGAQSGDPTAQKLARGVAIFQAAEKSGFDVGGWADNIKKGWLINIPYRTNLQAGELDRSRPSHIARGLYNMQLQAIARGDFPRQHRKAKR